MKVQVKNAQQNEQVDWSKNPQLVVFDEVIVLTDKYQKPKDKDCFCGTRIDNEDYSHYSTDFVKSKFKPFHGKITLQND